MNKTISGKGEAPGDYRAFHYWFPFRLLRPYPWFLSAIICVHLRIRSCSMLVRGEGFILRGE